MKYLATDELKSLDDAKLAKYHADVTKVRAETASILRSIAAEMADRELDREVKRAEGHIADLKSRRIGAVGIESAAEFGRLGA
jgi:hypothetical protein